MHTLEQLTSGALAGTATLKLSAQLTALPKELFQLADTLEVLDLSGNCLTHLPDEMAVLKKLRILFLSNNQFTEFPSVLGMCPALDIVGIKANRIQHVPENSIPVSLRWLILTDNCIEALPASIGQCKKLQKVMLAGNCLSQLPDTMAECKNIELLRISANNIAVLPQWLFYLPRLSWLAYANNPCSILPDRPNSPVLPQLDWNSFVIQEQLGEGASGIIYKAYQKKNQEPFAIKIFKGTVTSDGLPYDEMQACIAAGRHAHLVEVTGELIDHPQGNPGLVMKLITADYSNLGGPPNFITCTRDTFSNEQFFSSQAILCVAKGIASVAAQLHENGVMHGDLYAHNILINPVYHTLLGDFGAATRYDHKTAGGAFIERIEVRAFGCLLDDLLVRINPIDTDAEKALKNIRNHCFEINILERPDFKRINEMLESVRI